MTDSTPYTRTPQTRDRDSILCTSRLYITHTQVSKQAPKPSQARSPRAHSIRRRYTRPMPASPAPASPRTKCGGAHTSTPHLRSRAAIRLFHNHHYQLRNNDRGLRALAALGSSSSHHLLPGCLCPMEKCDKWWRRSLLRTTECAKTHGEVLSMYLVGLGGEGWARLGGRTFPG